MCGVCLGKDIRNLAQESNFRTTTVARVALLKGFSSERWELLTHPRTMNWYRGLPTIYQLVKLCSRTIKRLE